MRLRPQSCSRGSWASRRSSTAPSRYSAMRELAVALLDQELLFSVAGGGAVLPLVQDARHRSRGSRARRPARRCRRAFPAGIAGHAAACRRLSARSPCRAWCVGCDARLAQQAAGAAAAGAQPGLVEAQQVVVARAAGRCAHFVQRVDQVEKLGGELGEHLRQSGAASRAAAARWRACGRRRRPC